VKKTGQTKVLEKKRKDPAVCGRSGRGGRSEEKNPEEWKKRCGVGGPGKKGRRERSFLTQVIPPGGPQAGVSLRGGPGGEKP